MQLLGRRPTRQANERGCCSEMFRHHYFKVWLAGRSLGLRQCGAVVRQIAREVGLLAVFRATLACGVAGFSLDPRQARPRGCLASEEEIWLASQWRR